MELVKSELSIKMANRIPCVLFAPGVVILPIKLELSDFFESQFSLQKERTRLVHRESLGCLCFSCRDYHG